MGKVNENTICILEVGSTKTCVVVGEVTDAGLRYRGHGVADSRGSRKGVIVELDKATASIQRAVEEAESTAQIPIERATIGIGGPHIRGFNSRGGIALGSRPREINRDDVRQAVELLPVAGLGFLVQGLVVMLLGGLVVGVRCSWAVTGEPSQNFAFGRSATRQVEGSTAETSRASQGTTWFWGLRRVSVSATPRRSS